MLIWWSKWMVVYRISMGKAWPCLATLDGPFSKRTDWIFDYEGGRCEEGASGRQFHPRTDTHQLLEVVHLWRWSTNLFIYRSLWRTSFQRNDDWAAADAIRFGSPVRIIMTFNLHKYSSREECENSIQNQCRNIFSANKCGSSRKKNNADYSEITICDDGWVDSTTILTQQSTEASKTKQSNAFVL